MYGDLGISASLHRMWTAYSPGAVGQYEISADPSPLSLQSILACDGPSIENPTSTNHHHHHHHLCIVVFNHCAAS